MAGQLEALRNGRRTLAEVSRPRRSGVPGRTRTDDLPLRRPARLCGVASLVEARANRVQLSCRDFRAFACPISFPKTSDTLRETGEGLVSVPGFLEGEDQRAMLPDESNGRFLGAKKVARPKRPAKPAVAMTL